MAGFNWVARTDGGWRTRVALVVVVVAAAGTLAGVAGATPTTSTTNVAFVPLTVPHKVLNATYVGPNASNSPVVSGGSTTVPTDATTVRIDVSVKGAKAGTLSFYPADNPGGGSGQTLAYPAGSTVVSTTIQENIGLNNKITVVNTGAGAATVTATVTGYSTQVTAGDINGVGGTAGQVLTDNGAGGAGWTDIGHAYASSPGFFVYTLPATAFTISSVTVPPGTYAVSVSGTFQASGGVASAYCELLAPNGQAAQFSAEFGDSATVTDTSIAQSGVISTTNGGTISEACYRTGGSAQAGNANIVAVRVGAASGSVLNSTAPKGRLVAPTGKGLPVRR